MSFVILNDFYISILLRFISLRNFNTIVSTKSQILFDCTMILQLWYIYHLFRVDLTLKMSYEMVGAKTDPSRRGFKKSKARFYPEN